MADYAGDFELYGDGFEEDDNLLHGLPPTV
jgi:hypothetical protein